MSIAYKKDGVWVTASGTPPIDDALSATSENAVQNKIVKAAIENSASTLQQNFQAGVDDIYDAVVAKGSTPASKSLSDVVDGIAAIQSGGNVVIEKVIPFNYTTTSSYLGLTISIPNSDDNTYIVLPRNTSTGYGSPPVMNGSGYSRIGPSNVQAYILKKGAYIMFESSSTRWNSIINNGQLDNYIQVYKVYVQTS